MAVYAGIAEAASLSMLQAQCVITLGRSSRVTLASGLVLVIGVHQLPADLESPGLNVRPLIFLGSMEVLTLLRAKIVMVLRH